MNDVERKIYVRNKQGELISVFSNQINNHSPHFLSFHFPIASSCFFLHISPIKNKQYTLEIENCKNAHFDNHSLSRLIRIEFEL